MTWEQIKNATIPKSGGLRSAGLYSALVARSQHLVTGYAPTIGGVAPGSYIEVGAGATSTYCHPVIAPASGACSLIIAAHTTGSGEGSITLATSAGSRSVSVASGATTIAQYTAAEVPLSGSADRCTITVQNTAGSGNLYVFGGIIVATSLGGAELDELPPEAEILESGQPVTADAVRRLGDSCIYMARKRPPALEYFTSYSRAASENYTIEGNINTSGWYMTAKGKRPDHQLKISFTAPTTTYLFSHTAHEGFSSTQGGGYSSLVTHTMDVSAAYSCYFRNSANTAYAPVQSYVIYEVVP